MKNDDEYIAKQYHKALKSGKRDTIERAFNDVYNYYWKLLFTISFEIVKDSEASKEVVDDCFLSFFNKRDGIIEKKNLKYYLTSSARNASINLLRTKNRDNYLVFKDIEEIEDKKTGILEGYKEYVSDIEYFILSEHLVFGKTFEAIGLTIKKKTHEVSYLYYKAIEKIKKGTGVIK